MTIDRPIIGIGAAVLAFAVTFMLPVQARRVNQTLVTIMIVVLCFTAAFTLFDSSLAFWIGLGASLAAIIYRDVVRFVKHAVYGVTKYTRRDFWYRRIGQNIAGGRGRGRRW